LEPSCVWRLHIPSANRFPALIAGSTINNRCRQICFPTTSHTNYDAKILGKSLNAICGDPALIYSYIQIAGKKFIS
jgi:hypothetical protein